MTRAILPLTLLALTPAMAQDTWTVDRVELTPLAKDFAPVLMDSTVVMCSLRDRGELMDYRDSRTGDPLSDLYAFDWNGRNASRPRVFDPALNTRVNDGPASFTKDGNTICITRNQGDPNKPAKAGRPGLFFATRTNGTWSEPVAFAHNSKEHSVVHGTLSADGDRLVFASDMPGGSGGTDLYFCDRVNGEWSAPQPLKALNSPGNELFPTIAPNGMLYFSSERTGGQGKLDVLSSPAKGRRWDSPTLLPAPLNSPGNDYSIAFFPSMRSGFVSSDREGDDRIFSFERSVKPFADCKAEQQDDLCFRFTPPAGALLPGIPVHFRWTMGDGTVYNEEVVQHCYAAPGRYAVSLDLVDNTTGEVFLQGSPSTVTASVSERPRIMGLGQPYLDKTLTFEAQCATTARFVPESYTWDLGDGTSHKGASVRHAWRTPGVTDIRLDVQGHDPITGQLVSYCTSRTVLVLRKNEEAPAPVGPAFVFRELPPDQFGLTFLEGEDADFHIELFASKERVGLDAPIFTEVRKFYRVNERYDTDRGLFSYTVGQSGTLAEAYLVYLKVRELQFMTAEVLRLQTEKVTDLSSLDLYSAEDLANAVIRSSTVQFAPGSWKVEKRYAGQLEKVVRLLQKNPTMGISVEAHTDDVGADAMNLELSQKRAQSLVEFFTKAGVTVDRMVPIGQGENRPIAANDQESGRAQNRRVEFRLMDLGDRQASQHKE